MNIVDETVKLLKEYRYKLNEMARDKRYIEELMDRMSNNLIQHLIYCFLWEDTNNNLKHWKQEIRDCVTDLPRIKSTNKFPTYQQLKKWYLDDRFERINDKLDGYVKSACEAERKIEPYYNKLNLIKFLTDYLIWLCNRLSQGDIIQVSEVSNKIDELLKLYK